MIISDGHRFSLDAVNDVATTTLKISRKSRNGFDNFRVGVSSGCPAGTPFFPFSWHAGDGVAIIAARREGPHWTVRWNLASGSQHWSWQNSDLELMYALTEGTHQMADKIAASNAIAVSEQGSAIMDVRIGGLNNAEAYVSCLKYLQELSLVNAVEILGADPGRVHFRLQLNASGEHLSEAFERGSVLMRARAGSEYEYEFLR